MSKTLDDINGSAHPVARAQAKRMGMDVGSNPHDHTQQDIGGNAVSTADKAQQQGTANAGEIDIETTFAMPESEKRELQEFVTPKAADVKSTPPKEDFYGWYLKELEKDHDREEKRIDEDEERLKRKKLFATIGDGLSSLHEAYSYARGIEPVSRPQSLTGKWRERYERLNNERRANRQAYSKAALEALNGKRRDDIAERQEEYQNKSLELRNREEERRRIAANNAIRKQDWTEKYQQGLLDIKKEQLKIDEEYKRGLISKMERDAASNELKAQSDLISAQNRGGGGVKGYTTTTTVTRDNRGRETGRTTTRTPAGANSSGGNNNGGKRTKRDERPAGKGVFSGFSIHK